MCSQFIILVQASNVLSCELPDDMTFLAPCVYYADPLKAWGLGLVAPTEVTLEVFEWPSSTSLPMSAWFRCHWIRLLLSCVPVNLLLAGFLWCCFLPCLLACFITLEGYPRCVNNSVGSKLLLTQTKTLQGGWVKVSSRRVARMDGWGLHELGNSLRNICQTLWSNDVI